MRIKAIFALNKHFTEREKSLLAGWKIIK